MTKNMFKLSKPPTMSCLLNSKKNCSTNIEWSRSCTSMGTLKIITSTWTKSRTISMNLWQQSTIRSNNVLIWTKWSSKTFLEWKDSSRWNVECSTTGFVLSTGKSTSRKDLRKTEKLLTLETRFTGTDLPEYLEDGDPNHTSGVSKGSTTTKILSERSSRDRNWPCGPARLTSLCFIWLKWRTRSNPKWKQEKCWV